MNIPIQDIIYMVGLALAIVLAVLDRKKKAKEEGEELRWSRLTDLIPAVHALVQRIAKLTPTVKDDKFIELLEKIAKDMFGYELKPGEVDPLKLLGSAYHQDYKLARDGVEPGSVVEESPEDPSPAPVRL